MTGPSEECAGHLGTCPTPIELLNSRLARSEADRAALAARLAEVGGRVSDECASHQGTCPTPLALMQSRIDRLLVEWEAEGRPMWCGMAAYDLRAALQMGAAR